jgi:hypothetical protein
VREVSKWTGLFLLGMLLFALLVSLAFAGAFGGPPQGQAVAGASVASPSSALTAQPRASTFATGGGDAPAIVPPGPSIQFSGPIACKSAHVGSGRVTLWASKDLKAVSGLSISMQKISFSIERPGSRTTVSLGDLGAVLPTELKVRNRHFRAVLGDRGWIKGEFVGGGRVQGTVHYVLNNRDIASTLGSKAASPLWTTYDLGTWPWSATAR